MRVLMKVYYPCSFDDFKPHKKGIFQPLNDYLYMSLIKTKKKEQTSLNFEKYLFLFALRLDSLLIIQLLYCFIKGYQKIGFFCFVLSIIH